VDRLKKSKILITCQKNTFGELSSKILFKLSGTLLFSRNSEKYFLSIGVTWSFVLFTWFGGSLEQRYFTHFGKRQKLGNFRGL